MKDRTNDPLNPFVLSGTSPPELRCQKCGGLKMFEHFYEKEPGRLDNVCKTCRKEERRARHKRRPKSDPEAEAMLPAESGTSKQYTLTDGSRIELTKDEILKIAELFLTLEKWDHELTAQGKLSNSKAMGGSNEK